MNNTNDDKDMVTTQATTEEPWFSFHASRKLSNWLRENNITLGLSTYQVGKLMLISSNKENKEEFSITERSFNRCMGLYANPEGNRFWMSSLYQLWHFEDALKGKVDTIHSNDRVYIPQLGYTTGDCDIHDIAVDKRGRIVFVNTLFNCIASASVEDSFVPLWKPPFISKLAAEDRCHLNGLALREGEPRYVTAVSETDIYDGWREHRREGGIVMDITTNTLMAKGLSMPHSPRWYNHRLWLLNSGEGEFGYIDENTKTFIPIAFCPGYARGLTFYQEFALIGLSKPRKDKTFSGLALEGKLVEKKIHARCGIQVININTGDTVHSLDIEGMVEEIYDVIILQNTSSAQLLGFKTEAIQRYIVPNPMTL